MILRSIVVLTLALVPAIASAQTDSPAARAFDRYEAIRLALVKDGMTDVSTNAAALAPLAGTLAGKDAEAAVQRLRAAKTLEQARNEFGNVSALLVPKFMDAKLPGVVGYMCSMKQNAVWAQKGQSIENPYFGKVMLNCGVPYKR